MVRPRSSCLPKNLLWSSSERRWGYILLLSSDGFVKKKGRRFWVHPLNKARKKCGEFYTKFGRLRQHEDVFYEYFRMSIAQFDYLLKLVTPRIEKQITNWREPIPAIERLVVTLRFLTAGLSQKTLAENFCLGRTTVHRIIRETCEAVADVLAGYIQMPRNSTAWKNVAKLFESRWNMPNCVGALDGKHVLLKKPSNSGSVWYNYKGTFSVVLMAMCSADWCLTYVDVGGVGSLSDRHLFGTSRLSKFTNRFKNCNVK